MSASDTKTKKYFYNLSQRAYLFGAPRYWFEDFKLTKILKTLQYCYHKLLMLMMFFMISLEWSAFKTQQNLTEKQAADLSLFSFSHPIIFSSILYLEFYVERIREMIFCLTVKTKKVFNDEQVEKKMIKRARLFYVLFNCTFSIALVFYAIDAFLQAVFADGTFVTIITAWPDIDDKSATAEVTRVLIYFMWWIFMIRWSAVYTFIIPVSVCLSHQYRNLCSYFNSLNEIFDKESSQEVKEQNYEEALKVGIKLHSDTLWCTKEFKEIFNIVFSGQILIKITVLILLMSQMVTSEPTLANALATLSTAIAMLFSTGCLMWNVGDITVEASRLPTAIFGSGWQHCRHKSLARVRSLLLTSIWQSQRQVTITCLGVVHMSYESYLVIVKSSYSAFSVIYGQK